MGWYHSSSQSERSLDPFIGSGHDLASIIESKGIHRLLMQSSKGHVLFQALGIT